MKNLYKSHKLYKVFKVLLHKVAYYLPVEVIVGGFQYQSLFHVTIPPVVLDHIQTNWTC